MTAKFSENSQLLWEIESVGLKKILFKKKSQKYICDGLLGWVILVHGIKCKRRGEKQWVSFLPLFPSSLQWLSRGAAHTHTHTHPDALFCILPFSPLTIYLGGFLVAQRTTRFCAQVHWEIWDLRTWSEVEWLLSMVPMMGSSRYLSMPRREA